MYTLRHPPANLTFLHQLLWPLIFAQLVALKNWVRLHHGRGVPYGYAVSPWGRVTLTYVGARPFTSHSAAVTHAPTRFDFSLGLVARFALADEPGMPRPARGPAMQSVCCALPACHMDTS